METYGPLQAIYLIFSLSLDIAVNAVLLLIVQ